MQIGYERLFNMGNFEHEKFSVKKEAGSEADIILLVRSIAKLESDILKFRLANKVKIEAFDQVDYLSHRIETLSKSKDKDKYFDEIVAYQKQLKEERVKYTKAKEITDAFKKVHEPLEVACNCAFCQGKQEGDEDIFF